MPPDTSRANKSRKSESDLQDIQMKRLRGQLSCAECRRLKLKCDKNVPCGSCNRRGCESICPLGILSAGQGTRFILANTDQLHEKIAEMSNRIRQLEDALAIMQSAVSSQRHPLLEERLLKIKFGSEVLKNGPYSAAHDSAPSSIISLKEEEKMHVLGTLAFNEAGNARFYGLSGGAETLILAGQQRTSSDDSVPVLEASNHVNSAGTNSAKSSSTTLPREIKRLAGSFPFLSPTHDHRPGLSTCSSPEDLRSMIISRLPSLPRAYKLCESWIDHGSLFFRPLRPEQILNDDFLRTFYRQEEESEDADDNMSDVEDGSGTQAQPTSGLSHAKPTGRHKTESYPNPHALAAFFIILAIGSLLDITLSVEDAENEAHRYYELGVAAVSLQPIYDAPELWTVMSIGLMATYYSLAGTRYSRETAWWMMSLASKLAQSIGLHRDSSNWNNDTALLDHEQRRNLFWEVFSSDVSNSLALGRPPAIHPSFIDCQFPTDQEATVNEQGELDYGFWRMKHTFARDVFMPVIMTTLSAKLLPYQRVLDLDKTVRGMRFPSSFRPYVSREEVGDADYNNSAQAILANYASQCRTVTMLYLHRAYFAQAVLDYPHNPLLSPFALSFQTAYRCASILIRAAAHHLDRCTAIAARVWFLVSHTFSAAIVAGTIVTRAPSANVAVSAMQDLNLALDVFQRCAAHSRRAQIAWTILKRFKDKAVREYELRNCTPSAGLAEGCSPSGSSAHDEDDEDELAMFGGQARILKHGSRRNKSRTRRSASIFSTNSGGAIESPSDRLRSPGGRASNSNDSSSHVSAFAEEHTFVPTTYDSTPVVPVSRQSPPTQPPGGTAPAFSSLSSSLPYSHVPGLSPSNGMTSSPIVSSPNFLNDGRTSSVDVDLFSLQNDPFGWFSTPPVPNLGSDSSQSQSLNTDTPASLLPLGRTPTSMPGASGLFPHANGNPLLLLDTDALLSSTQRMASVNDVMQMGVNDFSAIDGRWTAFLRENGILDAIKVDAGDSSHSQDA